VVEAATVKVDCALDPGVMELGEKEHDNPVGKPEQESEIGLLKPPTALAFTASLADPPTDRVALCADNDREKSPVVAAEPGTSVANSP